jgi:hypothetical protein
MRRRVAQLSYARTRIDAMAAPAADALEAQPRKEYEEIVTESDIAPPKAGARKGRKPAGAGRRLPDS